VRLVTQNRIIPGNPVTPDPVCDQLGTVTVTYRLTLAPDGAITAVTATAGPPSVDLPAESPPALG
jgi:hypothetical protein